MAELNFNALARPGPRGFAQGFQQGQEQRMTEDINRTNLETSRAAQEVNRFKFEELKRDRDEMLQLQDKLKGMGQDPDLDKFMDVYISSGRPDYVKLGLEGKQKLKEQREFARLVGGDMAAPAAEPAPAPAFGTPAGAQPSGDYTSTQAMGRVPGVVTTPIPDAAPMNAMAPTAPAPAAPVNALANPNAGQIQQTQKRINDLMMFAANNPSMAGQAMQQAKLLQDQLELYSKRGPSESADVQTMKALGIPLTPEGYQQFTGAKRPDRLLTPEELAQKIQIATASRAPGTNITMVSERAEQGARGKMLVDQYGDISKAAGLAARTLPAIESNLSALNKGFDTGFGKETVAAGASVLAALGVKNAEKFATDSQMFQSNAISAVLQKQLEQKGPQTESDARRIEQIGAQLGKTKNANEFILATAKEQLKRDMDQRNFYDRWYEANKTYNGAENAWFNGEGGKSLFDRPGLKKYSVSATDAAAQIPTSATPARAAPAASAIPQGAIDALKAGRGTDAQFDEMFGPGAAKRARGGK